MAIAILALMMCFLMTDYAIFALMCLPEILLVMQYSAFAASTFFLNFTVFFASESGLQDQKSAMFLQSIISLDQILQHYKRTADIFLDFSECFA